MSINKYTRPALLTIALTLIAFSVPSLSLAQSSWEPAKMRLSTPWADEVNPKTVHQKYPRPQMVRKEWKNLNGLWHYAIMPLFQHPNGEWDGNILVPFPVESALSGVKKKLSPDQNLWYQRTFTIPEDWNGQRVLLHFGAVDWKATVWVNGVKLGDHRGGYDAFTFDITHALNKEGKQTITLSVWDPTDKGYQPYGKQSLNPRGIWYTASSGIWQTVWLEPVSNVYIKDLKMKPDIDHKKLHLKVASNKKASNYTFKAIAFADGKRVGKVQGPLGKMQELSLSRLKLWSPKHPFLYDLKVLLLKMVRL